PGNHDGIVAGLPFVLPMPIWFVDNSPREAREAWGMIKDRIMVLDTETGEGSLSDADLFQLERLNPKSEVLEDIEVPRRVFIFTHRPVWAEDDPHYSNLFKDNTRSLTGTNFQKKA